MVPLLIKLFRNCCLNFEFKEKRMTQKLSFKGSSSFFFLCLRIATQFFRRKGFINDQNTFYVAIVFRCIFLLGNKNLLIEELYEKNKSK